MTRKRFSGFAALCLLNAALATAQVQQSGQWAPIVNWPFVPIGITHLADGRLVGWASTQTTTFPAGATFTHAAIYDPATNAITSMNNTQHDTFCAGLATTGDGRIIVSGGGADVRTTSVLGMLPRWNQSGWTRLNDMINGRWYNSSITMNDGNILTMWGRSGGTLTEVFNQSTNLWTALSGISLNPAAEVEDGNDEANNRFPHFHWMPNGKILLPGPLVQMYWLDPTGNGSTQPAGTRTPDGTRYRKLAASVQYLPGKVLFAGGIDGRYTPKTWNTAVVIDATSGATATTSTGSMSFARAFHNLVVLPNGEVFVAGGNSTAIKFSDSGGILPAEIWNPTSGQWRTVASMSEPRGYHFLAILLRDGRVWAGGGGLCGCTADHLNGQIYSPGYLFNADGSNATRPQISLAPNDLKPGITIGVTGSDDITAFRLIRLQATTHGYNSDQRYVPVTHTKTGTGSYSLTLDSNQNVLVPGGYWLFALNANGTPSIGYNVQVYTTANWPGGAGGETNLAIGKTATQSSTASGGVAARAVDGNTNGDFAQNSVILTNSQSQPYWQVDLGARAQIASVKLWNRSDCCAANLTNFHVFVSDQPFTGTTVAQSQAQAGVTDIPHTGTAGATVTLPVNRSARYLRVQLEGAAALNFAEFEAIGTVITNNPPTVSITSPAPGTSVPAPGTFTIAATASDPENNLSKVEFYNGATKLGEDLIAPYSFVWSGVPAGNYTITVRAVDTQGLFTDATVNVSVTSGSNTAPTVSFVSPLSGAMFTAAADIVFNINAADIDNNLQKVELFNGAVKVGELTAAPFTFTVLNLAAGTYSFSAKATDVPGLSSTAVITIRVVNRQVQSLRGVPVPDPTTINSYVKNRAAAVALGKALFWDMQLSSDGNVACASCHFHAGADLRLKNQMNPGTFRTGSPAMTFDNSRTGSPNGPNYTTVAGDFPRHVLSDPANPNSPIVYSSKDVMGSHGQFLRNYTSATAGAIADACAVATDTIFGAARRSTGRNSPPVINAIFNLRNFWDGRANSIFNGVDSFGPRNANARIYRGNPPVAQAVSIDNASLASQAVAAPLNSSEMSCAGRTWPEIAKRLLAASALARQNVLTTDSVLGSYSRGAGLKGLNKTYLELVQAAFADDLHTSPTAVNISGTNYTQAQANFSLFFGLAVQLYQATLVSDQAPIDTYFAAYPSTNVETASALTAEQLTGLSVFNGKGRCVSCHHGPQLTNAATPAREANAFGALISKMLMGSGQPATYDIGYYNIGVRPTSEDLGIGGVDPFGNPLSITRQIKAGANVDGIAIDACTFAVEPCLPLNSTSRDAVDGAFKTPSLRNISLTGPYLHNGSLATLEEVVDFYDRGGNATTTTGGDSTGFGPNASNSHPDIRPLALTAIEKQSLVTFLKTALIDTRVQFERAPFDHPELPLVNAGNEFVLVPAVGSTGRATPLPAFADVLAAGGLGYPIVTPATPPTIAITAPANGASFTAPATVAITATATPISGTIAKVEFFNGATLLATVASAPYTTTLSNLAAGAYTITAIATDSNGASSSALVSFTVGAVIAPTVSITAPANNASFTAPASVTINANASTTQGTITQVEFYNGATLLGTDTTSPYSFNWANVAAGNYTLTARAIGSNGTSTTSAAVSITVNTAPAVPAPRLHWPLDAVTAGVTPDVATANNPGTVIGTFTLSPGTIGQAIQLNPASGAIRSQSQAISADQSFTVALWVKLANTAGTQTFVSQSGANVSSFYLQLGGWLRGRFTFDLYPSDSTSAADFYIDGTTQPQAGVWYHIAGVHDVTARKVRIYVNGVMEGEANAPQGGFVNTAPLSVGHGIWAAGRADGTDAQMDDLRVFNFALSSAQLAAVYNDRVPVPPPSVAITSPANAASFPAPASVTINADASTTDGTITQVEFYNGATLLGADTTSPYSFNWTNVAAGSYTLTAKAIGSNGTSTTSTAVAITVTAPAAPTVSITAPANNASFTAPASVTIDANAATTQGTITQVEFYNGATLLGADTTSPYSFNWTNVAAGSYTLTARAIGSNGTSTTSTAVAITVTAPAAPTVSITSPANNASFTAPASVTINANAATTQGTITQVEFYNGATLLSADTTAPYSFNWTNVAAGNYTLTAKAIGSNGTSTTSAAVAITVTAPAAPTVSITSPANNASFTAPASVTINANAATTQGTITQVEFYNGATLLSADTTSPYSFNWTNVAAGNYTLTAKAIGSNGTSTTSAPVAISVTAPSAPTVSITSPANNASFTAPASVTINANAATTQGTITQVEFYNGATLLSADTTSPYSFNWTNVAVGNYTLTAKAIGSNGTSTTSAAVAITVTSPAAPTVSITSPANNASFTAPASVTINANAATTQGTITQVEFYNGATLLGTDTTAPYSFNWTNVAAGSYTLTARAIGSNGTSTTSTAVAISVTAAGAVPTATGRWPLDTVTANSTPDTSGNNNHGTVTGAYTLSAATIGQGISLDPAAGAIRTQSQVFNPTQSFTVSMWVKLVSTAGTQTFASQSGTNVSNFYLQLGGWLRGRFTFDLYPSDSTSAADFYIDGTTQPQAGVWYHIAGVHDVAARKIRIYVNGVMEGEANAPQASFANTAPLTFGHAIWHGSRADGTAAQMDDIRAFNTALTTAEIQAVYNTRQ